ncbi:protein phosphatase 2C domain-containing protein [Salana multivorans]
MTTALSFHAAGATDLGTVRTNNEDAALMSARLVALADGMGGHAAGEVASAVVIDRLTPLAHTAGDGPGTLSLENLTEALGRARATLRALSAADPSMMGMGTTLVALALAPEGVLLAHVGDSRIYRLRDGTLDLLTTDHTHVQRLVEAGRLDPAAVRQHPFRSIILRSLDDTSDDLPDVAPTDAIAPGDRLLLCSDGLSDYVTDDAIAQGLAHGTPQEAADRLIDLALGQATRDNVTVVVVDTEIAPAETTQVVDTADDDGAGTTQAPSTAPVPAPPHALGATLASADLSASAREIVAAFATGPGAASPRPAGRPETAAEDAADPHDPDHPEGPEPEDPREVEERPDDVAAAVSAAAAAGDDASGDGEEDPAAAPPPQPRSLDDDTPAGTARSSMHQESMHQEPAPVRSGLWLGLVVLTFLLTAGLVWVTQT